MKKISIFLCFAVIFANLLCSSVYASELEGYPAFPTIGIDDTWVNEYVVYEDGFGNIMLMLLASNKSNGERLTSDFINITDTDKFTLVVKTLYSGSYYDYKYNSDSNTWNRTSSSSVSFSANQDITVSNNVVEYLYSDYDIHSISDGTVVFPVPPVKIPTLEEVTLEGLMSLQTETVGTMKILTVCGVGLLALLIGLVILPKILFRFL